MEGTHRIKFLLFFIFVATSFVALPTVANAATLYFSSASGEYATGKTFSVSVYISSADQAMNAASGFISFPTDKLEVASLSKAGSIFTLWVQEPSFSNSAGTINFEGIILNPGFTGSGGKAISVVFRAKSAGEARVSFSSGSALANDGNGTNILTGLGDANFSITGSSVQKETETITQAKSSAVLAAPEISSQTHSDQNKWYALKDAKFAWKLPPDTTGARLLVGKIPNATPTIMYSPPISSKDLTDLDDGVWYFHIRLKNSAGWGAISRFKFQIDTEKPTHFEISETKQADLTEPVRHFAFDATDGTSGIDHYEIQIDDEDPQIWKDDGNHTYKTPALVPGEHILTAKAVDRAGNFSERSAKFIVAPIESPIITDWPSELKGGERLIVRGKSKYPNIQIVIWLQFDGEEAKSWHVKSDDAGKFVFISEEKLKNGAYKLWANVIDERGAQSNPSDTAIIVVGRWTLLAISSFAVNALSIIVPLIALSLLLVSIVWLWWRKASILKKKLRIKEESLKTESVHHKCLDLVKKNILKQVKMLERTQEIRQLTEEEGKIIKQLRKMLDNVKN